MNLLADENVDQPIVNCLRQDGHNVLYIAEMSPSIPDDDILQQANSSVCLAFDRRQGFWRVGFQAEASPRWRGAHPASRHLGQPQS